MKKRAAGARRTAPRRGKGTVDREAFPYRMKDLCEQAGLSRQVVHFYVQQGLLPEGHKTGRNMAWYGEAHLERLKLIRQLQEERFLPLKAIRAMLEERDEVFSPAQRRFVAEVKSRLSGAFGAQAERSATVDAAELLARLGLGREHLDQLVEVGLLAAAEVPGEGGPRTVVARDDAWMLELWAELRAAGFTEELGFGARDFAMFEEAIASLFTREAQLFTERLSRLPPEQAAAMLERSLPLINTFLTRYHEAKIKSFFAAM